MSDFFAVAEGPKRQPRTTRRWELSAAEVHAVTAALLRDLEARGGDAEDAGVLRAVLGRLAGR